MKIYSPINAYIQKSFFANIFLWRYKNLRIRRILGEKDVFAPLHMKIKNYILFYVSLQTYLYIWKPLSICDSYNKSFRFTCRWFGNATKQTFFNMLIYYRTHGVEHILQASINYFFLQVKKIREFIQPVQVNIPMMRISRFIKNNLN